MLLFAFCGSPETPSTPLQLLTYVNPKTQTLSHQSRTLNPVNNVSMQVVITHGAESPITNPLKLKLLESSDLLLLLLLPLTQAGLSWSTILNKRDAYRRAFKGFDPAVVAAMGEADVEQLLQEGSGIVRHRGKIQSAIKNAG